MVNDMAKKALISPLEFVSYVSEWTPTAIPRPVLTEIGERVAEVVYNGQEFSVADPYFWMDCDTDVTAEAYYYDPNDSLIKKIPDPAPKPD